MHQSEPYLQPARRARCYLGDRAAELYFTGARPCQGLLCGLAQDRSRRRSLEAATRRRYPARRHREAALAAAAIQQLASALRLLDCFGATPLAMTENGRDFRRLVLH